MSCVLTVNGRKLDVYSFILKSKLKPYRKRYKGEPVFKTRPEDAKLKHQGFSILASNAGFNEFDKQVKDVLRFLKK